MQRITFHECAAMVFRPTNKMLYRYTHKTSGEPKNELKEFLSIFFAYFSILLDMNLGKNIDGFSGGKFGFWELTICLAFDWRSVKRSLASFDIDFCFFFIQIHTYVL